MLKACLLLSDGTAFHGLGAGAPGLTAGEVVFNTDAAGYLSLMTDPACAGLLVCMSYPLIGNYGVNDLDTLTGRPWVAGLIARHFSTTPSNWRSTGTLGGYMKDKGLPAIEGIDTRALTRHLRDKGAMVGALWCGETYPGDAALQKTIADHVPPSGFPAAPTKRSILSPDGPKKCSIGLVDFGSAVHLARFLTGQGAEVTLIPPSELASIQNGVFDGLIVSDAGESAIMASGLEKAAAGLIESGTPALFVGGAALLPPLALGAKPEKLRHGHRGANLPVTELRSGRNDITRQNNALSYTDKTLPQGARATHRNLHDGTVAGYILEKAPIQGVFFIPPNAPTGTGAIYTEFLARCQKEVV